MAEFDRSEIESIITTQRWGGDPDERSIREVRERFDYDYRSRGPRGESLFRRDRNGNFEEVRVCRVDVSDPNALMDFGVAVLAVGGRIEQSIKDPEDMANHYYFITLPATPEQIQNLPPMQQQAPRRAPAAPEPDPNLPGPPPRRAPASPDDSEGAQAPQGPRRAAISPIVNQDGPDPFDDGSDPDAQRFQQGGRPDAQQDAQPGAQPGGGRGRRWLSGIGSSIAGLAEEIMSNTEQHKSQQRRDGQEQSHQDRGQEQQRGQDRGQNNRGDNRRTNFITPRPPGS